MMYICKFGGLLLDDKKEYAKIFRLIKRKTKKDLVIIVVSAIGRDKPYSTNTLLNNSEYLFDKEKDAFISIGEQYSSLKLSNYLKQKGIKSRAVLLNELSLNIDKDFEIDITKYNAILNEHECLIVPGFLGKFEFDYIKTLGRGGSDLSAVLLAKYYEEKDVYLYKDTIGVYSSIDRCIINKETIRNLSYDQAITFFSYTGDVVQQKAIEVAKENKIRIHICNLDSKLETIISDEEHPWCIYGLVNIENKIYIFGKTDDYTLMVIKDFLKEFKNIKYKVRVGFTELSIDKDYIENIFLELHKRFIES
ncbi:MAG: hypothetical protein IJV94_01510 [Bacilli bacterium]|nr:hypothetical protein [Bacilli bacterium]